MERFYYNEEFDEIRRVADDCGVFNSELAWVLEAARSELTRLRAELAEAKAAMPDAELLSLTRAVAAAVESSGSEPGGVEFLPIDEVERMRAELAEARALVEKREAQIEWLAMAFPRMLKDGRFVWEDENGEDHTSETDKTRAGLLAAIDEACPVDRDKSAE